MSFTESVKFLWTKTLLTLICLLVYSNISLDVIGAQPPFWLLGLPPVMEAKHDGEGAGGQHLLVVLVVQAVGRCQCKSVSNLRGKQNNQICLILSTN